ncbi:MAG TPA: hypothetical protein VFQ87_10230 [Bradyrhizobium sp.]|nr:hypothetical protein [Bradyrhizobium sp.]
MQKYSRDDEVLVQPRDVRIILGLVGRLVVPRIKFNEGRDRAIFGMNLEADRDIQLLPPELHADGPAGAVEYVPLPGSFERGVLRQTVERVHSASVVEQKSGIADAGSKLQPGNTGVLLQRTAERQNELVYLVLDPGYPRFLQRLFAIRRHNGRPALLQLIRFFAGPERQMPDQSRRCQHAWWISVRSGIKLVIVRRRLEIDALQLLWA